VEQQSETIVDDEAKERFTNAQSQADSIAAQKEKIERAIQKFEEELRAHEKHLGELCMEFQGLALAGSFSGHIASAIRMLEVRLATMKSSGSDRDSIERMEERIESLRKQYRVVEKARDATNSSFRIGGGTGGERGAGDRTRSYNGGGRSAAQSRNPWGRFFGIGGG
jgi:capsule polysaccharide export protein KpsE/RkpR